ncbi:hypothetical protein B0H34DRAFT_859789 [Crassisporium funariophilum]|nr:hypothetical protein B0H34DRAFT_859789 [Crassisporium funariophilum]
MNFLTTIVQNSRLARFVLVYHCNSIIHYHENPLWDLLKNGLQKMVNLRELTFRSFGGHPAAELFDGCVFQLQKLDWGNHSDEIGMARVLVAQRSLTHLALESSEGTHYPPEACPHLTHLRGGLSTVLALLPGRHITHLAWVPILEDPFLLGVAQVAEYMSSLRSLTFGGYFARPGFSLTNHLDSLEILELIGIHHGQLQLLADLPNLKELVLTFPHRGRFPVSFESQIDEIVDKLFSQCVRLRCVDVSRERTGNEILYQRWTDNILCPSQLTESQVWSSRFGMFLECINYELTNHNGRRCLT